MPSPLLSRSTANAAVLGVFLVLTTAVGALSAKDDNAADLLAAELPHGAVLETASCPEMVFATRQAVRKSPAKAVAIMQRAIAGRVSPGERAAAAGHVRLHDNKETVVPCECLTRIVQAAVESAPASKVHELIEVAMSTQPQCAEEITALLKKPRIDGKDAPAVATKKGNTRPDGDFGDRMIGGDSNPGTEFGDRLLGGNGFEGGFSVNGFPGAPGFIGSAPGGGFAVFPPVVLAPLTSTVNR